jgi:hypothetical protein
MNNQVIQKSVNSYNEFIAQEGKFTLDQRKRIVSCACLLPNKLDSELDRIKYTIGVLKQYKKQGKAHNYNTAIDLLECEQVDDTNTLSRLINEQQGKVMSELYTNWYTQQEYADPAVGVTRKDILNYELDFAWQDEALAAFFKEYNSKLSNTVQKRTQEVIKIKSPQGVKGKIRFFFTRLYKHFEHKDSITRTEFFYLLKKYLGK